MQEERVYKRRKIIFLISGICLIGVIILGLTLAAIEQQKTAKVDILIAPSIAKVKIDDKEYQNRTTKRITPGEKTAIISAKGFKEQTIDITCIDNETSKLYVILEPEDNNKDWYDNHPLDGEIVNIISDYYTTLQQQEYLQKHPITTILPIVIVKVDPITYDWTEYRIDYGEFNECTTNFCLKITDSTGGNKENAIQDIRNNGFNPDDYEILYDYTPVEPI